MGKKVDSLIENCPGHGIYTGEDYIDYLKFQKQFRGALREIAEEAGYDLHKFIRNHYCCSAVLRKSETGEFAYVSIPDVRHFSKEWERSILYRKMSHERDWRGGPNCYTSLINLSAKLQTLYQ